MPMNRLPITLLITADVRNLEIYLGVLIITMISTMNSPEILEGFSMPALVSEADYITWQI